MDYRVNFFRVEKENVLNENTGKRETNKSEEFLGSIVIDDYGVDNNFPLARKAFQNCPQVYLRADKLIIERI